MVLVSIGTIGAGDAKVAVHCVTGATAGASPMHRSSLDRFLLKFAQVDCQFIIDFLIYQSDDDGIRNVASVLRITQWLTSSGDGVQSQWF